MSDRGTGTDDGDTAPESDETATNGGGETATTPAGRDRPGTDRFGTERSVGYLKWAGVAVLAVTALVALFGFYTGVSRAISIWVTREYRPIVSAAFNLALLLVALGGIGLLLRRGD